MTIDATPGAYRCFCGLRFASFEARLEHMDKPHAGPLPVIPFHDHPDGSRHMGDRCRRCPASAKPQESPCHWPACKITDANGHTWCDEGRNCQG